VKTVKELNNIKEKVLERIELRKREQKDISLDSRNMQEGMTHVLVCGGTGCHSSNSHKIIELLEEKVKENGLDEHIKISLTGCFGLCAAGPNIVIYPEGIFYSHVKLEDVDEIVEEHFKNGRIVERLLYEEAKAEDCIKPVNEVNFYKKQTRIALKNCGVINPEDIDEYIACDGYQALAKVITEMTQQEVIDVMKDSNLRGRGGAGFPTGRKWETAFKYDADKKYVICNADEGDPGAFMDRSILEGDRIGTEDSPGTKVFALGGKVNHTGLVEVPMGATLRDIVFDIGGGIPNGRKYKAVQTGGPSGGCIPAEYLDTPVDFASLAKIGSIMGSGGIIVLDETDCMVDIARFYLDFTVAESCGKCVPCREGTKRMLEILEKITAGEGTPEDLDRLETLADVITNTSLCGLGQTAANPVKSTLKYFRDEYEAHVYEKRCPAGVCQALLTFFITDKCIGCTKCARNCPVSAISGKVKERHVIDTEKCIKCGTCMEVCPTGAVIKR
jgi:NADH:ubiquinone oxidoreductase subunit F (NADH-binding)/(2Fe-2S) ferredoxin